MLEYISGTLTESSPQKVAIEINGLGYGLSISLSTYEKLPQIGKPLKLYVATIIREDAHKFFGFLIRAERDTFYTLTNISGVGPKIAIALLGHLPLEDLQAAVYHQNAKAIANVPGIGKKTAERLIVELQGKFKETSEQPDTPSKAISEDAISALTNLGYHPIAAQRAVRLILGKENSPSLLSDLISQALKAI